MSVSGSTFNPPIKYCNVNNKSNRKHKHVSNNTYISTDIDNTPLFNPLNKNSQMLYDNIIIFPTSNYKL